MHHAKQLFAAHPDGPDSFPQAIREVVIEAASCAQVCRMCADACLGEPDPAPLRDCIRRNLDCADITQAIAGIGGRSFTTGRDYVGELLVLCRRIAAECAAECERHDHEHCRVCAEACKATEEACRAAQVGMRG